MPNLPPPPAPAKGGSKGSGKSLLPPGAPQDKPQAPPSGPPVQVPADLPGTLRSAADGDELFEDGLQWTRILKNSPEKSTQGGSQQGDDEKSEDSFASSEEGEKVAAEDQGESATSARSEKGEGSDEDKHKGSPRPPPNDELEELLPEELAAANIKRRTANGTHPFQFGKKSILKQTTVTTEEVDPILTLLSGDLGSDWSPSGRNREPKVKIVDDQEEQRAQRQALRLQEAKAHEKELRMKRRNQMIVWLLMLPVRSVTYLGSCCISSPKTRQLWLLVNLAVSLFELWTCALFWAFSMDPKKLTILGVLLTADHWVNAWFLVDAMLQALDQLRGPEAPDGSESRVIVMRKVDWREQMQQKAKSMFQKLPGFSACSTEFLSKITDVGEVLTKQKGDVLYGEQEDNTSFYLILQGEVVVRDGDHVSYVGPGGTLGEFKVFDMVQADNSHVECISECAIFEVSEREMKRGLESSPADRNMLLEFFKAKLSDANKKHADGKWDMMRKGARTLFRPIVLFMESGVHGSRDIWLQAGFAIVLLVLGTFEEGILHAANSAADPKERSVNQNFFWILFLICKLMRQWLPLTYLKRFFVEQETQLFVNIRLTGSGGSTWVTLKLAVIMLGWGHWIGCLYLLVALVRPTPDTGTEDSMFDQFREKAFVPVYEDEDWWGDYLIAYYRAFNKNYEGAKPERLEELILQLFVVCGILAMKSYVIGSFFKLQEAKKESARELEQLLNQADMVCNTLDLPPSIRKSIRQYCLFQWSKSRDVGNRDMVLKTFAPDLQKKVKEQIYLPIIQANEILFHGATSDFMLQIIDHLEVTMLQPSELLFCESDAPQELCFLETGTLMLTCQEQLVRYARSDRPNEPTAIGEVAFVLKVPHLYSVRSRSGVESSVLRMSRTDFEMIMAHLDSDHDQLLQNAAHAMRLSLNGNDIKGAVHDGQEDTELFQMMRESVRQVLLNRTAHISTTFINAAAEGNVEQVELLLRKRVLVDTGNSDGRTAMHLAASEGRDQIMKLLIKAEGNVNLQDRWKGTPLRDAVMGKFSAVIELLMDQHADLNLEDPATALCDAASSGNLMALQELIEVKIDPNSGDYDLRTALHLAASEGKLEVISFLLDARADPNFKDRWGGTALEDAIQNNHAVAAQLIYSKKGGLRQDLAAGWLCDAAAAGNILKLQQLTENSVDVNSGDYDARTALHLAATEGQLLAVSYLIGSARAFTSPQDRWRSTPLQDAVRAGHTDCARLLAFTGGFLGDSATDEDREKLSGIISEDFSSPNTWPEVQKFQRRMNELNQRVSRLLVAVAKGKARPEVFDAEVCTKFNRQLICAVFKQCPQLADSMLALALIFRRLYADALVPLQSFTNLLQDSVDCTKHSKWWLWYAKQGKEERRQSIVKMVREPKIEKSASALTKLLVQTMQIGKQIVEVVNAAGKIIYVKINREVNARRIERKDYVIDEAYLAMRAVASNPTSQAGKSQTTKKRRKSFTGSLARTPSSHNTGKKEEEEDSRSQGNQLVLSEVCTECVFEALGWDVDWAAPASSNYGINAGAMKQQIEELGKVLASSQAGAVMEMWECLTTLPVRPFDAGAWRSERQAPCCTANSTEVTSIFGKGTYLKPMSLPLALELAMLSVLALIRTAPLNIEAQPSREETLTRIDICFMRNGLEAVEMEVRGDIAKTQREVLKKRDPSRTPGKKVIHMGGRFARVEPVSIGRILATQRDLSTDDLCAIIDAQDSTCQISAKMDEEDSDEDGKKRVDKKVPLRKDNKHILSHQSSFGVMSPERFQLNVLRHLLDFNSLQVDAIEADERRRREGVTDALEEDPFDEDFCFREVLSSGEVVWYDDKYIEEMYDLEQEGNGSSDSELEESDDLDGLGSDAQGSSPRSSPASPTHSISRRVGKRDGTEEKKAKSLWARVLQWFQSKQALFGGKARDQEARLRQKVARKFRELDEDGEGLHLADVATLLTDVFGHQLDRDAMLRLAANVYDAVEKSEQELMQLSEIQDVLETATQDYEAMVKRQRQHSSQKQGANSNGGWVWVQRLAGYVMPPDAIFLVLWDYVKSAVVIYYLIEVPMRFCMVNFDYLDDNSTLALIAANIGADVFMLANLPLNFLRGFEDSSGLVVRDFEQIRRRYLLGAFSWDLIAALPFDIFADPLLNAERTYATWRLLKLIHLRHLWGRRTESKSSDQQDYGFALTTVIVLLNFLVLGHFMGCIYWYIGNGWPTLHKLEEQLTTPERHTWFAKYQGMDYKFGTVNQPYVSVFEQYILSLYSMINILINDNNDILNPASWGELGWILGSFVVFVAVMGAIDGTLVGKVISQDESVVEQRVMKARINTFIKNAGLPNELAEQILVSEGGGDRQSGGRGHTAADARTLETVLSSLSHSLLQRIGRRVFLKWLSALPIFKDCSEPFLLQLTTTCRPLSVAAGSFLCRAGELTSFFFILRNGSVQLRDSSNEEVDRIDERGAALCDISCLFGLRHEVSIISEEESGFIKVPIEELNTALLLYPKDQEVIHNNVCKLTPNPSKDGQDDLENQILGATWAEDEEDMGKSQVSASTKRKKRKLAGLVDLMADLPAHDLSLDGVARVRKEIKKFQKTQEQERIGDFMAFAAQGKWEAMEAMLRSNKVHVNCTNWDGRTALHVAVSAGHLNVVEKLVMDFSALFTVPDRFGHTPLDDSVRERHSEVAEFLIEANAEFKSGVSAAVQLCESAANGDTAQLELLVEVIGVDPNLGDYDDRTALHLAASNGHLDTIQKMLDFPSLDLSPFDRFGLTPLDDAIRHGHVQVQKLLKHEGAQMGKVEFGVSLCEAASQNDHNKIRQMIEAGVRAGMADYDYRTALHLAASNGHLETCVFLLREGKVDPNPLDRFLHTPLDDAIRHEHLDVVQLLVKYRGRPSSDEEYLGRVRNDFIKTMEEENARKDSDKLEKELKTHGFADLLDRIARFRSEVEEEAHLLTACANNIRYDLCRILHASVLLNDESPNSGNEKLHRQIMLEEGATIQRLRYLMEKDLKTLDSSALKILELFDTELMPWLNSLRSNTHTKGLLPLLLPNIFEDMEQLSSVLRHVKALLPQLLSKMTTGTAGVGYDCKPFGLLCCRFLQPRSSDLQDLLCKALTLLVEQRSGKERSVTPWPGGAKAEKLFRTSNLVECLTCGLDPPPFKPQELGKRDAAAQQEDESV